MRELTAHRVPLALVVAGRGGVERSVWWCEMSMRHCVRRAAAGAAGVRAAAQKRKVSAQAVTYD